jgi:hypothetical protein
MANQVLNKKAFQVPIEPVKKHRIGAIILEITPILSIITGVVIADGQFMILSGLALSTIYIFGGWYIFKGDKYRGKDIVLATITAIFAFFPMIASIVYKIPSWPGANEMFVISKYIFPIFIIICVIWYFYHSKRLLEWRFSLKLLSRILLLFLFQLLLFDYWLIFSKIKF